MINARIRDGLRVNTSGIGILHTDYSMYIRPSPITQYLFGNWLIWTTRPADWSACRLSLFKSTSNRTAGIRWWCLPVLVGSPPPLNGHQDVCFCCPSYTCVYMLSLSLSPSRWVNIHPKCPVKDICRPGTRAQITLDICNRKVLREARSASSSSSLFFSVSEERNA